MSWLKRQSEVFGYENLLKGLNDPRIKDRFTLNQLLKGLYQSNIITNYMAHSVEVGGLNGKKQVQRGQRSLDDNEFKLFNIAIEERYNSLPGNEPLDNPFSKQSFGAEK